MNALPNGWVLAASVMDSEVPCRGIPAIGAPLRKKLLGSLKPIA
jgi:hypothetical protein